MSESNMKNIRQIKFKNIDNSEMVKIINDNFPISLKKNEDLINRIHTRYPILDKSQVAFIVLSIFQSMRELLILDKTISLQNLFLSMKLFYFQYRHGEHILPALRVKVATPPDLR